jgi:hypothetical protein
MRTVIFDLYNTRHYCHFGMLKALLTQYTGNVWNAVPFIDHYSIMNI